jgi:uncharacterized membrane protein YbaN (DUF454 family)
MSLLDTFNMSRYLYFLLAWVFFITGTIGAFLPVLPTTPFMLLALWAFSKSSQRFHGWLYNHPLFGPPLQQWHEYRIIPRMAKVMAVTVMLISCSYLLFFSVIHYWIKLAAILPMIYGMYFVLSKPSQVCEKKSDSE